VCYINTAVYRYETTNHLWLILEYCVGGDLMSLLRQVGYQCWGCRVLSVQHLRLTLSHPSCYCWVLYACGTRKCKFCSMEVECSAMRLQSSWRLCSLQIW
jgi:hypothetical protein